MTARAGVVALVAVALLGPAWMIGGVLLVPEGCTYPDLRTGSVAANLVLLSTDRLRAVDVRASEREDSGIRAEYDALARLANHGITVARAFAPCDRSPAAEASVVFSLLPSSHDVLDWGRRATPRLPTMLEAFAAHGYATAAVANLPLLWSTGLAKGVEFSLELNEDDVSASAEAAARWARTVRDRQFVLWVHHAAAPGTDPGAVLDGLVEGMVAALRDQRRYEETCVVAFATTSGSATDLEVPVVVRLPVDTVTDAVRKGPVSTLDLYPTLAKMLRVPIHRNPTVGRSLMDPPHRPLLSGNHFHGLAPFERLDDGGPRLGICAQNLTVLDGDVPRLFHRDEDVEAARPRRLSDEPREVVDVILERLAEARELQLPGTPATRVELSPMARERLARLGHLPGGTQR